MERNRRKFSRIPFRTEATLFLPDGEHVVEVLDLSLTGALIRPDGDMFVTVGSYCTLKILLDGDAAMIRMEATVVHHMANNYGLACREIDLDSATHLRQLVALNLGDEAMAERAVSLLNETSVWPVDG